MALDLNVNDAVEVIVMGIVMQLVIAPVVSPLSDRPALCLQMVKGTQEFEDRSAGSSRPEVSAMFPLFKVATNSRVVSMVSSLSHRPVNAPRVRRQLCPKRARRHSLQYLCSTYVHRRQVTLLICDSVEMAQSECVWDGRVAMREI